MHPKEFFKEFFKEFSKEFPKEFYMHARSTTVDKDRRTSTYCGTDMHECPSQQITNTYCVVIS